MVHFIIQIYYYNIRIYVTDFFYILIPRIFDDQCLLNFN